MTAVSDGFIVSFVKRFDPDGTVPTPKVIGREDVERWLFEFQRCIRSKNYTKARTLFHSRVIAFGTSVNRADSLDRLEERQWRKRWPDNGRFEYLVKSASVIPGAGMFVVAVEWCVPSPVIGANGRNGRATLVLLDFDGKLLCAHSHHSELI